jgi:hypothetical protein
MECFMKRIVIFVILVFSVFGLTFAQSLNAQQPPAVAVYDVPGPSQQIISGVLGVSRGMITLSDKNGVAWYVLGLDRFVGLIDGLDLGETVELEGYAPPAPGSSQERLFQVTKLRLDNMDYELTPLPEGGSRITVHTIQPRTEPEPDSRITVQSGKELVPAQPKSQELEQNQSHNPPWVPTDGILWMRNLDLNAIWK